MLRRFLGHVRLCPACNFFSPFQNPPWIAGPGCSRPGRPVSLWRLPAASDPLGILTAFAGYTAVYALNDLVDFRVDREKLKPGGFRETDHYLDNVLVRHPLAYGLLGFREALLWAIAWAFLALVGATC